MGQEPHGERERERERERDRECPRVSRKGKVQLVWRTLPGLVPAKERRERNFSGGGRSLEGRVSLIKTGGTEPV